MNKEELGFLLQKYNQEHVLQYWNELNEEQQANFARELKQIDYEYLDHLYKLAMNDLSSAKIKKDGFMECIPENIVAKKSAVSKERKQKWWDDGLAEISHNSVGVLLLAGGQGTRLGVSYPKGMYDVGLPSHKTLYQLQAERILKLQELANKKYGGNPTIRWYIMTSEATLKDTKEFFEYHSYFGLEPDNVIFFKQQLLPCLSFEGKLILATRGSLAMAPDGNGGLYRALKAANLIEDMEAHGIKHVHVYCVDNILVNVADPYFTGFCMEKNSDCSNKVILKVDPKESVGVVCKLHGKYQVVEYSEISQSTSQKRGEDGSLIFKDSNICVHYFSRDFLKKIVENHLRDLPHHVAKKKIPYIDTNGQPVKPTSPNGIKLEKFVFDVFQFSSNFSVFEAERFEEFSPLKNGPDSLKCSPVSCRNDVFALHRKYLKDAGAVFINQDGDSAKESNTPCEVSPLLSYSGEGLEEYKDHKFILGQVVSLGTENGRSSPDLKRFKSAQFRR